jgi:hypothetical protein
MTPREGGLRRGHDGVNPADLLGRFITDPIALEFFESRGGLPKGSEWNYPSKESDDSYVYQVVIDYCQPEHGVDVRTSDEGVIQHVFLHQQGNYEGYERYIGALPLGLEMTFTQPQVRALLGRPQWSTAALESFGRRYGPMDRHDYPPIKIHLEYAEETSEILLITLFQS